MAPKIYWIHQFENLAKIGTMSRPKGNEWLEEEIVSLQLQNVDMIISLLEREEIIELGLRQQELLCAKHGIEFRNFPIGDRKVPNKSKDTDAFILDLFEKAQTGLNIVIHCRMGIGRSSIIAASVLILGGQKAETIMSTISKIRGLKVPDTEEQSRWLQEREWK